MQENTVPAWVCWKAHRYLTETDHVYTIGQEWKSSLSALSLVLNAAVGSLCRTEAECLLPRKLAIQIGPTINGLADIQMSKEGSHFELTLHDQYHSKLVLEFGETKTWQK